MLVLWKSSESWVTYQELGVASEAAFCLAKGCCQSPDSSERNRIQIPGVICADRIRDKTPGSDTGGLVQHPATTEVERPVLE